MTAWNKSDWNTPDSEQPVRVAIVGGGCAALTAAFELTRPEHMGRYQVTVYQMGWRLGGKGASGRGASGRIEEHGLHLWMGFYENAFRLMRDCYAERHAAFPNCRFAEWRDAFKPAPDVCVTDRTPEGWSFWLSHFPPAGQGEPGDPAPTGPSTVLGYLRQSAMLIGELLRSAAAMEAPSGEKDPAGPASAVGPAAQGADALVSALNKLFRYGQLATTAALIEAAGILREAIDGFLGVGSLAAVPLQVLDALANVARRQLELLVAGDGELKRVWQVIDLILAIVRGSLRANLALDPRGFDAINDYDWREWLRLNGASEQSLDSGFMRGIYDLVFAFEGGDVRRPSLAAGVALRGAMRMFFTYRGSLFWRMSAGMGDVVFAPLYQVLKQRGVRFEFFHRLRNVGLSPAQSGEPSYVQSLEFDVQAKVNGGGEYQPLIDIHNVPSWPSKPDYAQLMDGGAMEQEGRAFEAVWERRSAGEKTLQVGRDFDFAVLGVSIGALPDVARELIERDVKWRDMVRHVKTASTQAFQLWMRHDVRELGWKGPAVNLSGFVAPFDTWADMTHLAPEEGWKKPVKAIAYFCGVLPDPVAEGAPITEQVEREQRDLVRVNAVRYLNNEVGALWPRAARVDGGFRWETLAAEGERCAGKCIGENRFDSQFWNANVNPTDRYVQSLPGSIAYRLSPLDMTFDNLTIAGDWTATGLDSGCIESAIISGMLAAHAISRKPRLSDIVGYDHP